ncbi:DEAD/DEAH box helicase family protein [Planktothrix agardhii 1032]|uniref:type I restriction endonuclease subunit R n=1 Tax=Planktothrix agardhii TaxID=1160 RepID=UPI001D0A8E5E|nr:DEAD/DEAH box helicase family protein [Planktothrix agardhii]MCB8780326.1 DEAD/DEAH box helicase family protein [Planktothrix agardhii 1031]MCF3600833.1 DEAD/DEAH box helicase family protein [Planktothrix agardhii 1032]CAD5984625.1 Putative type-1 restriction enzyme MjaXP R protein [Planktothrix agardhii]
METPNQIENIMSNTREINFEDTVFDHLKDSQLYTNRQSQNFNLDYLLDIEQLEKFIRNTQPDIWKKLEKQFPENTMEAVAKEFAKLRDKRGILTLIREGFVLQGATIRLIAFKPASDLNPDHLKKYQANQFSVIRQVHYSSKYPDKSLDLAIAINGIPIATLELKNEFTGQNITHAVEQYSKRRDSKDPFLKNCLVHFAVDNNTVLMTTKLENGNTTFLPFNRDTKNPIIPDKFASSYLWEEVLQADSLLEMLNNYIFYEEDEKTKEIKTVFPRYHQRDCVRQLLANVKQNGTGHNYLIQHSAGSGKSKTIAWLAHQLANLFGDDQEPIFDSIIVITDRIVLDTQLQKQIKQFEKINGTVKNIKKGSKELIQALTDGDKIIISTLQKFGYIGDLAKLNGKRFAIIVDEAHSSQSGENVKDLKLSLTTDEALKKIINQDEENTEPKDSVEEELEKIMASRQQLPHLSFFAFTATPKPKTLKLFGIPDPSKPSGYRPCHEYTMRQAIDEGFILNVLDNYITKNTYFELIENENAEDDKAFEKLKAKRLLLNEVNKHPYAIASKSYVMLNHFMDSTIHKINGKAKAMLVTSSRAHAVLYKLAFDKIIQEQGYNIQTLVAFSGTVEIDLEKYTEDSMNPPKVKDIAEEFKKPQYKILIVANKFQTGFDQPLLHTMYVDKALGGVATVQTLSRLNRITNGKKDTLVIDFANKEEDIKKDFQDYYQTTTLEDEIDTQKIYNLKYEIEKVDVFSKEDVTQFIEKSLRKKVKSEILSADFRKIIDENYVPLDPEDKKQFRDNLNKYIRQYAFISQIITFIDTELEKFYLFVKLLYKYLPYEKATLPLEIIQMVNMDKYRLEEIDEKKDKFSIKLNTEDATITNNQSDGHKPPTPEPTAVLETIIKEINEKYSVDLGDDDKVVKEVYKSLKEDEGLLSTLRADNNTEDVKRMKLSESIEDALLKNAEPPMVFLNKLTSDKGFANHVVSKFFNLLMDELKDDAA